MKYTYINPIENKRIKSLLNSHGDSLEYKKIIELCNSIFPRIPISINDFKNTSYELNQMDKGGMNVIYRAREIKNEKNIPFESVSEISYISEEKKTLITEFGRANKQEQSMFYGAIDYPVACAECIGNGKEFLKKGVAFFVVGIWQIIEPLKLAQLPYSENKFEKFYNTVNFKSESIQLQDIRQINKHIKNQIRSEYDFNNLMFFADEFARFDEDNTYKLSNYYCDRIFNNLNHLKVPFEIEGILYPSIVNSYQKNNIVLKPSVVDQKLRFISAMLVWFNPSTDGKRSAEFIPIKQHIKANEEGKLMWDGISQICM